MHISLIWAMSRNRVIGCDGGLPWRLPKDMQFFMATTMGKPVLMGRKTFETLPAPLPGRTNIVITRDRSYQRPGIRVANDLDEALSLARAQCEIDGVDEIMIAGGAEIYALALPLATRLYVTTVQAELEGDTHFPELDGSRWRVVREESFPENGSNEYPFTISVLERSNSCGAAGKP